MCKYIYIDIDTYIHSKHEIFQSEFLQTASEISEPFGSFEARRGGAHSAQPLEFRQPNWQKWSGNPGRFTESGWKG